MEAGEGISNTIRPPDKLGHRIKTGWFRLLDHFAPALTPLKYSYFRDLGLKREIIAGKTILDTGAGLAQFADVYHGWRGTKIYSLDEKPGWFGKGNIPKDIPYVKGDVKRELPFADVSFDLVVSRLLLPYVINDQDKTQMKKDFKDLFTEVKRVLKVGGEYRFDIADIFDKTAPDRFGITDIQPGMIWREVELDQARHIEKINQYALEFLREIDPNVSIYRSKSKLLRRACFVLRKE